MNKKWFAVYLFYPADLDLMLQELIHPFLSSFFKEESDDAYFFIRYWENGSHIRLRMNVDPDKQEILFAEIKNRANVFFAQYPALMPHSELETDTTNLNPILYSSHKVIYASYEPEITRYGNLQSMPWAETHFFKSSAFILDWMSSKKTGASVLVQALSMHLILLCATRWDFPQLFQVCNSFINGWLPRLYDPKNDPQHEKEIWLKQFESSFSPAKTQILAASKIFWESMTQDAAKDKITQYLDENTIIMQLYSSADFQEAKLIEIVTSMMHMNHNRLGISNYEEAYGAYCLQQVLQFISNS